MAITWDATWTGVSSTTYATAGNWTGGVPLAGEAALVPAASNAIAGADQSAADLAVFKIDRSFQKDIGSSGSPLFLASNLVICQGVGARYLKAAGNGIDYLVVDMDNSSALVTIHPNTTAKLTNLILMQGTVTLAGEAGVVALCHIMSPNVRLDVASGAGGFTTLINGGAEVISRELVTNLRNGPGGRFTQLNGAGATVTNMYLETGSQTFFDHEGTIALVNAQPRAELNLIRNGRNKTITTLIAHKSAIIHKDDFITVTNALYGGG